MSLVARLLARLRGRTLVGGDEHGNLYYKWVESVSQAAEAVASSEARERGARASEPPASLVVERRAVRTPSGSSPQKFDAASIPPEWSAWLRKTRRDPPSPEEAAANAARRERVRSLAAAIDRRRLLQGGGGGGGGKGAASGPAPAPPLPTAAAEAEEESPHQQQQQQHSAMYGTFSAETWTPPPGLRTKKKEGDEEGKER